MDDCSVAKFVSALSRVTAECAWQQRRQLQLHKPNFPRFLASRKKKKKGGVSSKLQAIDQSMNPSTNPSIQSPVSLIDRQSIKQSAIHLIDLTNDNQSVNRSGRIQYNVTSVSRPVRHSTTPTLFLPHLGGLLISQFPETSRDTTAQRTAQKRAHRIDPMAASTKAGAKIDTNSLEMSRVESNRSINSLCHSG